MCEGYEGQFRDLLIAIEVGQPSLATLAARKERELKKLFCSINYDMCGSVCCSRGKE